MASRKEVIPNKKRIIPPSSSVSSKKKNTVPEPCDPALEPPVLEGLPPEGGPCVPPKETIVSFSSSESSFFVFGDPC